MSTKKSLSDGIIPKALAKDIRELISDYSYALENGIDDYITEGDHVSDYIIEAGKPYVDRGECTAENVLEYYCRKKPFLRWKYLPHTPHTSPW